MPRRADARAGIGIERTHRARREPAGLYSDRGLDYRRCETPRVRRWRHVPYPVPDEEVAMHRDDRRSRLGWLLLATLGATALMPGAPAEAQLAISANDN